jgi:alpha-L-rhamnosidase
VLAAVLASVAALHAPAAGITDGQAESRVHERPSAPAGLRTNSLPAPADVNAAGTVEFGSQSALRRQRAYKIDVTRVGADRPVWESGKVESAESSAVRYAGPPLRTGERYRWRVQVWDEKRRPSGWSGSASFGTGPGADWGDSAPVWPRPPDGEKWTDYRLDLTLTVTRTALGVRFRSPDAKNGYMWQFRAAGAANPNTLVPHVQTDGRFSAGEPVPLGTELQPGTAARGRRGLHRLPGHGL